MEELFDVKNFNIIEDEENYYFFRALNMADTSDLENGIIVDETGNIERIRTDRERYEGKTKYSIDSEITLEEVYDHIKMHYLKETNCISLSSNANVSINYGRGSYKDRYVLVTVPKKEIGLDPYEKIGNSKNRIAQAYRENGGTPPTDEQKARLLELGISLEKRRTSKEIAEATISSLKDETAVETYDELLEEAGIKEKSKAQPDKTKQANDDIDVPE